MIQLSRKKQSIQVVLICCLFGMLIIQPFSQGEQDPVHVPFPNPNDVAFFNLDLPPGEKISSFEEYQTEHPYSPVQFSQSLYPQSAAASKSCSILIESRLYTNDIEEKINRYSTDLEKNDYTLHQITTVSGGDPEEIKDWVTQQYHQGVTGVIFIGDIPVAWAEVSGDTFPSDLFYMDIDGSWVDANDDSAYESHTAGSGDMGPELFVSRLFISPLNWNDEHTLLVNYFDKVHQYNMGDLSVPWNGLEYIDEDWYTMDVALNYVFDQNITHHDFGYQTTGQGYLSALESGNHFVTVCAHSYPGGHHFSRRPTEAITYAHTYVYSPVKRDAKLLIGCDDGVMVWWNGENVLEKDRYNRWLSDQFKVDISIEKGWNRLLCKVSQDGGDYQLSARITDTQYQSIPDLKYQINDPDHYEGEAEFIRSWLAHGFNQDSPDYFYDYLNKNYLGVDEYSHIPYEGQSIGGNTWTVYNSAAPYVDLDTYNNGADFGVSYCFVTITSDQQKDCELWLGYDDGMKAWLNGDTIVFDNRYGDYLTDMNKVPVRLQAGENHLLIKLSEWMGGHGFSARFCTSTGGPVEGLEFTPEMNPISYIGTWLLLGPYANADRETRLTTSYISSESRMSPSEGDQVDEYTWTSAFGGGRPFDIAAYFNHGDWVFSEDVQSADPPALFYNLFACSAGRFTENNYLAASYIFNTQYGLTCLASSKSGSMLNFHDFTSSLGGGKSMGEAFVDWFDRQAPFALWEQEWYYGMILFGDPTLSMNPPPASSLDIDIASPTNGLYLGSNQLFSFFAPVVFGAVPIQVDVVDPGDGIREVAFYVDETLMFTDEEAPYEYVLDTPSFGKRSIRVVAEDVSYHSADKDIVIWKFF